MRPTKPTEIKLLIFWGSEENVITRNTLKKIKKVIELSGKAFLILSIPKKNIKRTILLQSYASSLLIDGETITNPKDMAENFNNFFTSIRTKSFKATTLLTSRQYIDYLKHPNPKTFSNLLSCFSDLSPLFFLLTLHHSVNIFFTFFVLFALFFFFFCLFGLCHAIM